MFSLAFCQVECCFHEKNISEVLMEKCLNGRGIPTIEEVFQQFCDLVSIQLGIIIKDKNRIRR